MTITCQPINNLSETHLSILECGLDHVCNLKGECTKIQLGLVCPCKYPYRCIEGVCRLCIPGTKTNTEFANFECSNEGTWKLVESGMSIQLKIIIAVLVILFLSLLIITCTSRRILKFNKKIEDNKVNEIEDSTSDQSGESSDDDSSDNSSIEHESNEEEDEEIELDIEDEDIEMGEFDHIQDKKSIYLKRNRNRK